MCSRSCGKTELRRDKASWHRHHLSKPPTTERGCFIRAATLEDPTASWHAGHMTLPTAWGQAPDGFVYITAYPTEPPDGPNEEEPPAPLYRVVLAN